MLALPVLAAALAACGEAEPTAPAAGSGEAPTTSSIPGRPVEGGAGDGGGSGHFDPAAPGNGDAGDAAPGEELMALGIRNLAAPLPGVLTAGQITPEQMDLLAGMGVGTFINLRPATEAGTGWEEEHAGSLDGVRLVRLPIAGGPDITRANAERLAREMEKRSGGRVMVYCASSNRVGALLALKAHHVDGTAPEEALALGQAAGLSRLQGKVRTELGISTPQP